MTQFQRMVQTVASRFGFFELTLNTPFHVGNFSPHECMRLEKIFQLIQTTRQQNISYLNNPTAPVQLKQQIFRGYPFTNVYNRKPTDAGPSFITEELLDEINQEGSRYSMSDIAQRNPNAIYNHIMGMTSVRSYSSSWGVAAAFALGKAGYNGAACLEQVNHTGCILQADLISEIYHKISQSETHQSIGEEVLNGNKYQREHGSPFMPAARLSCISILGKEKNLFHPSRIFNILNPLDAHIQAFLLANGSEEAVHMLHEYDQCALQAAAKLSRAYYKLINQKGLNANQQQANYEKFYQAYDYVCHVEAQFRLSMNESIKMQRAQGNIQMLEVPELPSLDINAAKRWFVSAKSLAKGFYTTSCSGEPIELQRDSKDGFFIILPTRNGQKKRITLADQKVLAMLPGYTLGPFHLLSSHGCLKKEALPRPLGQAVATSFITELLQKNHHNINSDALEYVPSSKENVAKGVLTDSSSYRLKG